MREKFKRNEGPLGERERPPFSKVQKLREEIEQVNAEIEKARARIRSEQGGRAANTASCPSCRSSWQEEEEIAERRPKGDDSLLRDKVTEEEIARIVSRWTGIPVTKLMEGEREKLLHLDDMLAQAGHRPGRGGAEGVRSHPALAARASRTRTARSAPSCSWAPPAWARPSWPRRWRRRCSTTRSNMVRIDMSEYMEKYSVSPSDRRASGIRGLRGGRPADRGRAPQALFASCCSTRWKRRIPDVFNILLQVLDDGRITDSPGPHGGLQEHHHHPDLQPRLSQYPAGRHPDDGSITDEAREQREDAAAQRSSVRSS